MLFPASSFLHSLLSLWFCAPNLSSLDGSCYFFVCFLCPGLSSKRSVWVSAGVRQLLLGLPELRHWSFVFSVPCWAFLLCYNLTLRVLEFSLGSLAFSCKQFFLPCFLLKDNAFSLPKQYIFVTEHSLQNTQKANNLTPPPNVSTLVYIPLCLCLCLSHTNGVMMTLETACLSSQISSLFFFMWLRSLYCMVWPYFI